MSNQAGYVEVNGGKIYYEMAGEGKDETVVILHTAFVDSGMWDMQWEALAQHYRVIRFDMRGYGKSSPVEAPVSRRDELHALLQALKIEQAHLLGCSLGGEVVIDYTLEHPKKVLSLIVLSAVPGGFEMQGEPPQKLMEMFGALQSGDVERISELQMQVWVDGEYRKPEQVNAEVRKHAARMNQIPVRQNTFAISEMQPLNPLNPPAVTRLKEIYVPALCIAGALDHPELIRAASVMEAEIPNARKHIIEDAAHVPNMEKPEEFNRVVLDFLKKV